MSTRQQQKAEKEKEQFWTIPKGVIHCPITPYYKDGRVDYSTFEKVVDFHIKHGTSVSGVLLHTAESLNLSLGSARAASIEGSDR